MAKPMAYSYIRFSSPAQEKGDSLRRQLEQSEEYARNHGLILDDSLRFTDRGVSAYKGFHRIKGALGDFITLAESGKIEKGSVLIVENLDRLSREHVLDALSQFITIIKAGIKLVTLQDGQEYTRDSIDNNFAQLIVSITYMARAHEESATKSKRVKAAWSNKRNQVREKRCKLTGRCPGWLELSNDKKTFKILPERAEVINLIFEMKLSGKGSGRIEKELNQSNAWSPKNGWRKSYINKLLHNNRAVIGEFQPYRMEEGKRIPDGSPIIDYFPAILDKELFDRVQALIHQNRNTKGNAGGRNGPVNNLFGHLAFCGRCGAPMAYLNKGPKPKGGQYLQCDSARRGLGCIKKMVCYEEFEKLTLTFCKGLDAQNILPVKKKLASKLSTLRNQLQAIEGELSQLQKNINNTKKFIATTDSTEAHRVMGKSLDTYLKQNEELEKRKSDLKTEIEKTTNSRKNTEQQLKSIQEMIIRMDKSEGQDRIDMRLNLRDQLRRLIDRIAVYPLGVHWLTMEFLAEENKIVKAKLEKGDYDESPELSIDFKTGDIREISFDGPHLRSESDVKNEITYTIDAHGEVDVEYFGKLTKQQRLSEKIAKRKKSKAMQKMNEARKKSPNP